jgi:hypothetical protein
LKIYASKSNKIFAKVSGYNLHDFGKMKMMEKPALLAEDLVLSLSMCEKMLGE